MKKISLIILTYNNLQKFTKNCWESIRTQSSLNDVEVVFVDNCSNDGTKEWLLGLEKEYSFVRVILNKRNLGYAAGNNVGIKQSSGDYIVLMNKDVKLPSDFIKKIRQKDEAIFKLNIGLLGPVTNNAGCLQQIKLNALNESNWIEKSFDYCATHRDQLFKVEKVNFYCVVIPRYVINDVGYLDENFGLGNFEDDDYCERVKKKYGIYIMEDCFVWHYGSGTFKDLPRDQLNDIYVQNKFYFEQKNKTTYSRITDLDDIWNYIQQSVSLGNAGESIMIRKEYIDRILRNARIDEEFYRRQHSSDGANLIKKIDYKLTKGCLYKLYKRFLSK